MLLKQRSTEGKQGLKVASVMLSWGIYGASVEWKRNIMKILPEDFIKLAIPYILAGIDLVEGDCPPILRCSVTDYASIFLKKYDFINPSTTIGWGFFDA